MKIYEIKYEDSDGNVKRQFASSDGEASKMSTALKASGAAVAKPKREAIDVLTDKTGLIAWLNKNATIAELA